MDFTTPVTECPALGKTSVCRIWTALLLPALFLIACSAGKGTSIDIERSADRLRGHLEALTVRIGERGLSRPANLGLAAAYIKQCYQHAGLTPRSEFYSLNGMRFENIITEIDLSSQPSRIYLLGAHYDSAEGSPGADDNASGVAVQLEVARRLAILHREGRNSDVKVRFGSFALEESPAFASSAMGSRIYAEKAKQTGERIDGMLCLEMVGYTCKEAGCQRYPMLGQGTAGFPDTGEFIGVVGNLRSEGLTRLVETAFIRNTRLPVISISVPDDGRQTPSFRLSDHSSFWDEGFPAVLITDTAFYRNNNYHTPSDSMDNLDYPFMEQLVESLLLFLTSPESK